MQAFEAQFVGVNIDAGDTALRGDLYVPAQAQGLVLFAHGSGSHRQSPRNRRVAEFLQEAGLATLLLDLLAPGDEQDASLNRRRRFDLDLLALRLREATRWARQHPDTRELLMGYYGAGTGGAAAILSAVAEDGQIGAVVARGSPTNLVDHVIAEVVSPTLLVVGGHDSALAATNLETWARLNCTKSIEIVPGAGHLFEERGALDNVAAVAARWFDQHLRKDTPF